MIATREHYGLNWPVQIYHFLERILNFVLKNGYVQFDGKIFVQHKGLAMGTPSAPILANITLAMNERQLLEKYSQIYLSRRYIEDVFCIVKMSNKLHTNSYNPFIEKST